MSEIVSPFLIKVPSPPNHTENKCQSDSLNVIELSLHTPPKSLVRDLNLVFGSSDNLYLVPTTQPSLCGSLLSWNDETAKEKDRLLEVFFFFCNELLSPIVEQVNNDTAMEGGRRLDSDWIDPCSGLPMKTQTQVIYDEVASHSALLKYTVSSAGGCKVMLHDKWGEGGYPATLILSGTEDQVRKTLAVISEKFGGASS
mmetsp:Transcript_21132/g.44040  ORF Transcript_21132/g.44040 Transcript_21132/m.44040 type:complete len:199 (-) Transcript_21132:7-603(-)